MQEAMRCLLSVMIFLTITNISFSQQKTFEIFGTFVGEHKDQVFLFFDNDFAHKDSLVATVSKNGHFYFKVQNTLPILCRLHCGDKSSISEFYPDQNKTYLTLSSNLTEKATPISFGGARANFKIKKVTGSTTDNIIRLFQRWNERLEKTKQSNEQKNIKYFNKLRTIVVNFPKSKASAYLIAGRIYIMGRAFMFGGTFPLSYSKFIELTSLLDTSLQTTLEGENIKKILSSLESARHRTPNEPFYDISLTDTSGNLINTITFRNKYVLIDFWASWCKPCRALSPDLKKLYSSYKDKGFEIVGISIDKDIDAWKKAIIKDGLDWTQLNDSTSTEGVLCKHFDIRWVPSQILIDKEGKVIGFPTSINDIEKVLAGRLNNSAANKGVWKGRK